MNETKETVRMTNSQERRVNHIKEMIEQEIKYHKERYNTDKEIVEWQVELIEGTPLIMVYARTNLIDGNCFTELVIQLFIGKRGGTTGTVRTFGNEAKIRSNNDSYMITCWI